MDTMPLNVEKVKSGVVRDSAEAFAGWILSPPYRGTHDVEGGMRGEKNHVPFSTRVGLQGVLFDLDGVLVDTARFHFLAWKRLAVELGVEFDERVNHGF